MHYVGAFLQEAQVFKAHDPWGRVLFAAICDGLAEPFKMTVIRPQ